MKQKPRIRPWRLGALLICGWVCLIAGRSSAQPANDNFANRLQLTGTNITNSVSNTGATAETGEPSHNGTAPAASSIWFKWTAPTAGGVEITATAADAFGFPSPILAVYTGATLVTLTKLVYNSPPFSGGGEALGEARVVFTAASGQAYQIALDGANQGNLTLTLRLSPPPANDVFSNATTIPFNLYDTSGSFAGASRESGEPSHGNTNYNQTLWWTWTAPNDPGVGTLSVRLIASAVSLPPDLAVYTGNSVSNLTSVSSQQQTNGMTRSATFTATAGTTYRIAMAGSENDTTTILPLFGNFLFHLNTRTLALSILNLTQSTNADNSVTFAADARMQNLGSAASNPLRVYVAAVPGASMRGSFVSTFTSNEIVQGAWPATPVGLLPGQSATNHIVGTNPPPGVPNQGDSSAMGYGVFARLQEDPFGNTWFTVDETLALFGNWPSFDGISGPGGGAIRLDPSLTGAGSTALTNISIIGSNTVPEGGVAAYKGRAKYANGTQYDYTNTSWAASLFSISNGVFRAGSVTNDTVVKLTNWFSYNGVTNLATTNILVSDVPQSHLISPMVSTNRDFNFQLQGVPSHKFIIQAANALSPVPINWLPLSTNTVDTNGIWKFTNSIGTNRQRFYRALETQ